MFSNQYSVNAIKISQVTGTSTSNYGWQAPVLPADDYNLYLISQVPVTFSLLT
ncbi:MAG: hypothetical protein MAG451_01419 [Anaerolineales bacterium]|nr:hypothetical protein [Anaerolineales bacterium]